MTIVLEDVNVHSYSTVFSEDFFSIFLVAHSFCSLKVLN